MQALTHVSSAIRHAECLGDEAADLGLPDLARRLHALARALTGELEAAVLLLADVEPSREGRNLAHHALQSVYGHATLRLESFLPRDEASRLSPGGHLDVVERVRYRLRRLVLKDAEDRLLLDVRTDLERALFAYETTVDAYLLACAEGQARKDRVVAQSQVLRLELERAKHQLLATAEAGSDAWKRIKRRAVRTKRARFVDGDAVRELLSCTTTAPELPLHDRQVPRAA